MRRGGEDHPANTMIKRYQNGEALYSEPWPSL